MENSQFDDLLTQLGTGKWSFLYIFSCCYWMTLLPPQFISSVYLTPFLNYTCLPPLERNVTQISSDSCSYMEWSEDLQEDEEFPCTAWDFDTSVFKNTLTSEFSLVCERESLRATYQSCFMVGTLISPLLCGYLADRFGRKVITVACHVVLTATSLVMCLFSSFTAILVIHFITGASGVMFFFYYVLEVCEPKHRITVGMLLGLPWSLGTVLWGGAAYLIRDWRWLQFAVSVPLLFVFPLLYLIDESPRWLIVCGHHDRALRALQKAARWNNAKLPPQEELLEMMKNIQKEAEDLGNKSKSNDGKIGNNKQEEKCLKAPALISTRKMTLITCVLCWMYFVEVLVFGGLNLSGENYDADPFLYLVLSGLMEVPAYTLTIPLVAKLGRKGPNAASFMISGICTLALTFIPTDMSVLILILAMIGKLCISAAIQVSYIYCTELLPTEIRLQGVGAAVTFGQTGSIAAPYIVMLLGQHVPWVPSVVFGVCGIVAALTTLALPETLGAPLPDSIADLDDLWKKKSKRRTTEMNGSFLQESHSRMTSSRIHLTGVSQENIEGEMTHHI